MTHESFVVRLYIVLLFHPLYIGFAQGIVTHPLKAEIVKAAMFRLSKDQ